MIKDVIRSMRHDYTGAVEDERITVFRPDTTLTFATHTEYDQGERPYRITYRFENDSVRVKHTHNDEGRLSRTDFGINLARRYEYDIHGWPVRTETLLPFRQIVSPGDLQLGQRYYSDIVRRDTLPLIIRPPLEILSVNYTERMHYADGAFPRYTGEMSGRTTTFGSRYDYRYDAHDRLIGADYTAVSTDSVGEDFSTSYTYDAIGRPLTLRRYGVLGIDGGEESFGLLDGLFYSYVGALPSSITRETEATEFYGRTGAVATEFDFNEAGLLTQDSGRSLINVNYNRNGLPIFTEVKPRRNMIVARSDIEENTYSSTGKLISTRHYRNNRNVKQLLDKKTLLANFTFASGNNGVDTLMRVDFPGGYFDNAGVHWMLADAIGSIEMVVDGKGRVEQHTGYYPYGEPWREPAGQPYLFGGKERRRFASLGDSDFHARFLTTSTGLWQAPDVHAGNRPWISPFVFCSANPIRRIDPTGMDDVLRGSGTKTPPGIKLFDDEEEYKRNAALNAEPVENDLNSSQPEPAEEERSLLEKAAIGTEALATPMSVQNQLIESASESATGLEGSAAVQKYLGKAGIVMFKGAQYLGRFSVGVSTLNSGFKLYEYWKTQA